MARQFNTTGPCNPEDHFMLPTEPRLPAARELIEEKLYFVVHAPRQSGKTTCFQALARTLTAEGNYAVLHASCERGQVARSDIDRGVQAVLQVIVEESELLPEHADRAAEMLIERRDTHLDSLIERLREARVERVISPILEGELVLGDSLHDDISYVKDLGLVASSSGHLEIANPIYHEVIPRALAAMTQETIPYRTSGTSRTTVAST